MKILLPFVMSLLFSGCLFSAPLAGNIPFDPEHIYQGYPCRDQCAGFKRGYDLAQSQQFLSKANCPGPSEAEKLGCEAYLTDYHYASTPDPGLRP